MLTLSHAGCHSVGGDLPPDTLAFLHDYGVPESVILTGHEHLFTLDMEPLLDGGALRIGTVDFRWCSKSIALQRTTGHFGYVGQHPAVPAWEFCNSSVANFVKCCAVCERLWEMQEQNQIAYEARAEWLEERVRQIDPLVLTLDTCWVELIADIRFDVV